MKITFPAVRDIITFAAGVALGAYEILTTRSAGVEPSIVVLGLAAAMMGVPGTLGLDRVFNRIAPPPDQAKQPENTP